MVKFVRGNLVIIVGLGLKVGWNPIWFPRVSLSIENKECVSIDYCLRPSIDIHGRWSATGLYHFISKMQQNTTFFQITPKPENILKKTPKQL